MTAIGLSRPQAGVPRNAPLAEQVTLDLADIQSFVLYPVAFPFARFGFWRVPSIEAGRQFVASLVPLVTNAVHTGRPHDDRKPSELTLGFTFDGLAAVGVPWRSLASFAPEFQDGMKARAVDFRDELLVFCSELWLDEFHEHVLLDLPFIDVLC